MNSSTRFSFQPIRIQISINYSLYTFVPSTQKSTDFFKIPIKNFLFTFLFLTHNIPFLFIKHGLFR
jgi:hypothetical protein